MVHDGEVDHAFALPAVDHFGISGPRVLEVDEVELFQVDQVENGLSPLEMVDFGFVVPGRMSRVEVSGDDDRELCPKSVPH